MKIEVRKVGKIVGGNKGLALSGGKGRARGRSQKNAVSDRYPVDEEALTEKEMTLQKAFDSVTERWCGKAKSSKILHY